MTLVWRLLRVSLVRLALLRLLRLVGLRRALRLGWRAIRARR